MDFGIYYAYMSNMANISTVSCEPEPCVLDKRELALEDTKGVFCSRFWGKTWGPKRVLLKSERATAPGFPIPPPLVVFRDKSSNNLLEKFDKLLIDVQSPCTGFPNNPVKGNVASLVSHEASQPSYVILSVRAVGDGGGGDNLMLISIIDLSLVNRIISSQLGWRAEVYWKLSCRWCMYMERGFCYYLLTVSTFKQRLKMRLFRRKLGHCG